MAGIKGLNKNNRQEATKRAQQEIDPPVQEEKAQEFIKGAQKRGQPKHSSSRTRLYERHTFSLTGSVSNMIDEISYMPKDFRANRSDVIKAAVDLLRNQPKEDIIKQLMKVK